MDNPILSGRSSAQPSLWDIASIARFFAVHGGKRALLQAPSGLFRNFVVESKGEYRHQLDLKWAMTRIEQTMLKEIFKRIRNYQVKMRFDYTGVP